MKLEETKVIDNWLEPELSEYLSEYLQKGIYYTANHGSVHGDNKTSFLFGIIPPSPLIEFLSFKIKKIKLVNILRVYTNLHYNNMGGDWHKDDGKITFIYMASKNVKGGEFEIKDEEKIEYKFNRLIYFDAKKLHKGNAPLNNVSRITLAFKTIPILKT